MAKEVRLIDANAYPCNTCDISYCYKNCDKFNAWFEKTVDAVEVVRCKDCTQWCRNCGVVDSPNGHCYYHEIEMNAFDFCSYGERRTDNGC